MSFKDYIRLARPQHYYKNLVIFIAVFFSRNLFNEGIMLDTFLGFLILCIASSGIYSFNDALDAKKDRMNPEKKTRPVASGSIGNIEAFLFSVSLMAIALSLSYFLDKNFFLATGSLIFLSILYTIHISKVIFLDIILISINFVVRVASGGLLNDIWISPWLIAGTLFLAFFLAGGKRKSELGAGSQILNKRSEECFLLTPCSFAEPKKGLSVSGEPLLRLAGISCRPAP